MTEETCAALRNSTFSTPVANASYLKRKSLDKTLTDFLSLNAHAIRHSPEHRLWSSDDVYASHQCSSFGASLMVLRICKPDGTFTDPLIVVAGPMATPLKGEVSDSHNLLSLEPTDDIPNIHGTLPFPTNLAPTAISVAAAPQTLVQAASAPDLLKLMRSDGRLLTVLDSQSLHSMAILYDGTDFIAKTMLPLKPDEFNLIPWALSNKHAKDPSPDGEIMEKWISMGTVPPDPRSASPWTSATSVPRDPYVTALDDDIIVLFPETTSVSADTSGFLLLPRFLRFPLGVFLPIRLVIHPQHTTGNTFCNLIAVLLGHTSLQKTKWLSNVFLDAWFKALAANPGKFQSDAVPHPILQKAFPSTGLQTTISFHLHLEWSIATQILWDQAFAKATGTTKDSNAATLTAYDNALIMANNKSPADDSLSTLWGCLLSVLRHPFLPKLHPLPDDLSSILCPQLALVATASSNILPLYIRTQHCCAVKPPDAKGTFSCPSLNISPPSDDSSTNSKEGDQPFHDARRANQSNVSAPRTFPNSFNKYKQTEPMAPPTKHPRLDDILGNALGIPSNIHLGQKNDTSSKVSFLPVPEKIFDPRDHLLPTRTKVMPSAIHGTCQHSFLTKPLSQPLASKNPSAFSWQSGKVSQILSPTPPTPPRTVITPSNFLSS
jgi:hypothetical protein